MAVPKRKTSKARRDKRRASSYTLSRMSSTECPQCHEQKLPHRVCRSCGFYRNKEVISVD
nr:50S ribosomal protein L32 [Tissierella sp.]